MVCEKVKLCCQIPQDIFSWCADCRDETTDSKIVREERKKRYCLENPRRNHVVVFAMDGGIIHDEVGKQKCDYLYAVREKENIIPIFVELKGKDVAHGLEQILESVRDFYGAFSSDKVLARIICKSVPRITNDQKSVKLRKELKEKYHGELVVKENSFDDLYFC